MIHPSAPITFSACLNKLRLQLLPAFTGQKPGLFADPVPYREVDIAGRNAKDALIPYAARP